MNQTSSRSPLLLFFGIFLSIVILFYIIWNLPATIEFVLHYVNAMNANITSTILNLIGYNTVTDLNLISDEIFDMRIKIGCDGLEPIVIYSAAVLAFPTAFKYKWKGVLYGVVFLFILNIVRLLSLFLIGHHWGVNLVDFAHLKLWQFLFIFLAVGIWIYWMNQLPKEPTLASNRNKT